MAREARPYMKPGSSIMTMTYYGAEKVVPHYNVMGVAKAALEATTRYLAADLGPVRNPRQRHQRRARPDTLRARHRRLPTMYGAFAEVTPLRRHITIEDVAGTAVYLASPLSGQTIYDGDILALPVIYVDGGFNILARMPMPVASIGHEPQIQVVDRQHRNGGTVADEWRPEDETHGGSPAQNSDV
jgi:enoyl-[acyl-carrier protein] reductase I